MSICPNKLLHCGGRGRGALSRKLPLSVGHINNIKWLFLQKEILIPSKYHDFFSSSAPRQPVGPPINQHIDVISVRLAPATPGLLTTRHHNNRWDVLKAAFCDSRDVFFRLCSSTTSLDFTVGLGQVQIHCFSRQAHGATLGHSFFGYWSTKSEKQWKVLKGTIAWNIFIPEYAPNQCVY